MSIAEQVLEKQDIKEMTRRAILLLKSLGQDVSDLEAEFLQAYQEEV